MATERNGGLKRWQEIIGFMAVVVSLVAYIQFDRAEQRANSAAVMTRFERLEAELLGTAEAERIRDSEWEHDDELRVADQDRTLSAVRVTQDQITSSLAEQTVLLGRVVAAGDERFLQRENRFEELELEHKTTRAALADVQFALGVLDERTRLISRVAERIEQMMIRITNIERERGLRVKNGTHHKAEVFRIDPGESVEFDVPLTRLLVVSPGSVHEVGRPAIKREATQ